MKGGKKKLVRVENEGRSGRKKERKGRKSGTGGEKGLWWILTHPTLDPLILIVSLVYW